MPPSRLDQLHQLLSESPDDSFLLFALAKEYEKQEDWQEALSWYLRLLKQDAAYLGTYYHLGKLYEKLDQPQKARSTYTQGMETARQQGDQHALSELAGARLALGDEDDY